MLIGELSERTGVSVRSIRHYDESGLLEAERKDNGYRAFDASAIGRVLLIKRLIDDQLTIADIRPLIGCLDELVNDDHLCDRLIGLYESKLHALDDEIADLSSRRYRLADRLRQMRAQRASRFSDRRGQHA